MKRLYLANHCVSCLNNSTPAIKFTCNDSNKEINFLDDKKRLSETGKTQETELSANKTDKYQSRHWIQSCFMLCKIWIPCSLTTTSTLDTYTSTYIHYPYNISIYIHPCLLPVLARFLVTAMKVPWSRNPSLGKLGLLVTLIYSYILFVHVHLRIYT